MAGRISFLASTIGRKQLVGLTGLGLSLFVLTHMAGNLLIFVGPEAYNLYSNAIITNRFLYVAEIGLLAMFVGHVFLAIGLTIRNKAARPQSYAVSSSGYKGTSLVAKTMVQQGLVIFFFVVLHLITFKYGNYYEATYDGETVRDLHRLVIEVFQSPAYVGWYTVALVVLGLHLSYGVASAFQTFGINHPKYNLLIKRFGLFYAVVVALGFISQPIYVFFFH